MIGVRRRKSRPRRVNLVWFQWHGIRRSRTCDKETLQDGHRRPLRHDGGGAREGSSTTLSAKYNALCAMKRQLPDDEPRVKSYSIRLIQNVCPLRPTSPSRPTTTRAVSRPDRERRVTPRRPAESSALRIMPATACPSEMKVRPAWVARLSAIEVTQIGG